MPIFFITWDGFLFISGVQKFVGCCGKNSWRGFVSSICVPTTLVYMTDTREVLFVKVGSCVLYAARFCIDVFYVSTLAVVLDDHGSLVCCCRLALDRQRKRSFKSASAWKKQKLMCQTLQLQLKSQ